MSCNCDEGTIQEFALTFTYLPRSGSMNPLGEECPIQIALYGHDSDLLETRQMLLRSHGYLAVKIETLDALRTYLAANQISSGLVLCHTVNGSERARVVNVARSHDTKIISLSNPI